MTEFYYKKICGWDLPYLVMVVAESLFCSYFSQISTCDSDLNFSAT